MDRGAEVNTRNHAGQTELHKLGRFADSASVVGVMDFFLREGVDETTVDSSNRRAIDFFPAEGEGTVHASAARRLLLSAPRDRAWRRRSLLVMCMALGKSSAPPLRGPSGPQQGPVEPQQGPSEPQQGPSELQPLSSLQFLESVEPVDTEIEMEIESWDDDVVASVESPSMEVDSLEAVEIFESFSPWEGLCSDWLRTVAWLLDCRNSTEGVFRQIVGYL